MTADAIFRLVDRAKADVAAAGESGPVADILGRFIDDCARECASFTYLLLDTRVAQAGPEPSADFEQSLQADAALRSLEFAERIGRHLGPYLAADEAAWQAVEWDAMRAFTSHLAALARVAGIGGSA